MDCKITHTSVQLSYKLEIPMIPSTGSISCYNSSQNSERHFTQLLVYYERVQWRLLMSIQVGAICRAGMWGDGSSLVSPGPTPQRLHLFTDLAAL